MSKAKDHAHIASCRAIYSRGDCLGGSRAAFVVISGLSGRATGASQNETLVGVFGVVQGCLLGVI